MAALVLAGLLAAGFAMPAVAATKGPQTVHFLSDDGATTLVGYLYRPEGVSAPAPAVVMMHGRAGPYSSLAKGVYDAKTLSKRTKDWAALWTGQGYWALVIRSGFTSGSDRKYLSAA